MDDVPLGVGGVGGGWHRDQDGAWQDTGGAAVFLSPVPSGLCRGGSVHGSIGPGPPPPYPVAPQVHQGPHLTRLGWALQENVSCLNTSLVILMLARRKERLPLYLRLLQRMEHSKKYPGFLLNNFHNLLRFWQQHYLHKDKDSTCLENVRAPPEWVWWVGCGHADPGPLGRSGHVPAWQLFVPLPRPSLRGAGLNLVLQAPPQPLSLCPELLHQLLILERDRVHPVKPGPPVTLCPCQLHRGALHGHRQGLHRGVTLGQASGGCWARTSASERGCTCRTPCPVPTPAFLLLSACPRSSGTGLVGGSV